LAGLAGERLLVGQRFQLEVVGNVETEDGCGEEELALNEGGIEFPAVLRGR